jgi:hypothetical protein
MMPHAQNAGFEVSKSGTLGRVVLKDMRDVEFWPDYIGYGSRDQRLSSVDKNYLRYQMLAHPWHYDVDERSASDFLPAAVFNYSFQMLRNHVFRGLQSNLGTLASTKIGDMETFESLLTAGIVDTCNGNSVGDVSRVDLSTRSARLPSRLGLRQSWRLMRNEWVKRVRTQGTYKQV